jgi:PEP-CTERM motif
MKAKNSLIRGLTIIGLLFGATSQIHAQGIFSGGQPLNISFSEISGSGSNQPFGGASYFQNGWDYDTSSPAANVLVISINLGANQATDGWILQMNDGSLSPVMELTNEIYNVSLLPSPGSTAGSPAGIEGTFPGDNPPASNYYSQSWQLTDHQVQNLLAGNWYVEVNYGSDEYLGNLTPVPEPETLALVGLGMMALFFRRRE